MGFLSPFFLLGALAVAVPLLIHLSRRHTREAVQFPSLMFLAKVPYRSVRRRRLRDLLLLAMRCAAIVALALAFARPLLHGSDVVPANERTDMVVLVDRSFSMGYGDRWQRALDAAHTLFSGLDATQSVTLVAFDENAEMLSPPTSDGGRLDALLASQQPGSRVTRYGPAFKVARAQLLESRANHRGVVLIGDLQRGDLGGSVEDLRLPPGAEVRFVDVTEGERGPVRNLALADVTLDRAEAGAAGRDDLTVGVRVLRLEGQAGDEEATAGGVATASLRLEINERTVEEKKIELAGASQNVSFKAVNLEGDVLSRGRVTLFEDPLAADNQLEFVVSPADAIPVLLVDDGAAGRERSLYVERALATARRPRFRLDHRAATALRSTDLDRARAVLLIDAAPLVDASLHDALVRFVDGGGGLLLALGRRDSGGWSELSLPGAEPMEQELSGRSLAFLDYDHPVFEAFAAARSGDFSSARFFRFRRLPDAARREAASTAARAGGGEGPEGATRRSLARFDDGSPALIEVERGEGRVLVWASTLDAEWGDLVLQPVFVPWIDALTRYLANYQPPRETYRVGQVASLELPDVGDSGWLVVSPAGGKRTYDARGELLLELDQAGFYDIRPVQGDPQSALTIAANVDPTESDLSQLDREELAAALTAPAGDPAAGGEDAAERERDPSHQRLWWFVLLTVLLLLAGESLLSNRRRGLRRSAVEWPGAHRAPEERSA